MKRVYRKPLLFFFGSILFLIITFVASVKFLEKRLEDDVSKSDVKEFPVVVITHDSAKVTLIDTSERSKDKDQNFSFLIPVGQEDKVNQWLRLSQQNRGAKGLPEVRVKQISEGRQEIELEIYSDGFFVSRYEAEDKQIRPLMLKITGPGWVFYPCSATLLIGGVSFGILQFGLWLSRRIRLLETIKWQE